MKKLFALTLLALVTAACDAGLAGSSEQKPSDAPGADCPSMCPTQKAAASQKCDGGSSKCASQAAAHAGKDCSSCPKMAGGECPEPCDEMPCDEPCEKKCDEGAKDCQKKCEPKSGN